MDFELTDDQASLQEGVRAFLAGRFPLDAVRGIEAAGHLDRGRWQELGDTGVFSIMLPEAEGGLELGVAEAALVFEELGRALVPGPLVASFLAAPWIDGAVTGETIVGHFEPGTPVSVVEHPADLDAIFTLAPDGVRRLAPAALTTTPVERPVDALTPLAIVHGEVPAGDVIADAHAADRARLVGTVLTSALQLGLALRATELATAYAKEREQFGRVIGSFQAVKHLCADMLVRAEVARAAVYAAAVALDGRSDDDSVRAAAAAKILAGDAAIANGKAGIQVHGGIGFTWEVDAQRFWKRAVVLDTHFGNSDEHAEAVAAML
ncbi:MAG TPA: acyl-CoA dehydrogenase family protein [Acidimicrobiia bacterium]|nr:acyl-CoA dehydrogenase family protein [Acidimicrobiia bacterium]